MTTINITKKKKFQFLAITLLQLLPTFFGFTNNVIVSHTVTPTSKKSFASLHQISSYSHSLLQQHNSHFAFQQQSSGTDTDDTNHCVIDVDFQTLEKQSKIKNTKNQNKYHEHSLATIQGLHPFFIKAWQDIKLKLKKPTHKAISLMTAAFIMAAVIFTPLSEAFAAPSGGRMGGSFGGGSRSSGGSSRSSYSRSYSSPSRSFSSSSYNRGFSQGYGAGYYSRPSIIVSPTIGSSPYYYPSTGGVAVVRRGPSLGDFIIFSFFALIFASAVLNNGGGSGGVLSSSTMSELGQGVTVAQVSVALNVPDKDSPSSILTYLNRLSQTARTDSRVGVSSLVSQVALELLRQKKSVFAASTEYKHYRDSEKAEREFSTRAIQERSKFESETISKYGGVDYAQQQGMMKKTSLRGTSEDFYSPKATAAVVTLIVAIDGDSTKLPVINSQIELTQALMQIATDVKVGNCLRSAEVLWTPEDSDDVLSEMEVIADYPELRTI